MRNREFILSVIGMLVLGLGSRAAAAPAAAAGCAGGGRCVLSTPAEATPLVLVARAFPLLSGGEVNVSLTETLGGVKLMAKMTDASRQPDPKASATVFGMGHFGSRGLTLARVSPGVWACMANLANLDELAVRVHRPGTSQVVYVGVPGRHLGGRCGGKCEGGAEGQGEGAKCPMHENCPLHRTGQDGQQ